MAITPRNAWGLSRVLSSDSFNGELDVMDGYARRMAEYLVGIPLENRKAAFDAMLAAQDDPENLITAIANVDPLGPAPEGVDNEPLPVVMRAASEIEPLEVEWLWKSRIPLGMITLFAGDPKLGKSLVTIAIAASVSRGVSLPGDNPRDAGSVILLNAEDDPARTIVPRLKAAGAILSKVHILESVYLSDGVEALPSLRKDIGSIESAISSLPDCRLVIVDPVSAYLGGTDDHKNGELRGLLSPLKAMAQRANVAIILVTHMNKSVKANPLHGVMGSVAYTGAARANFLFMVNKDDPTGKQVLFMDAGCNLAPRNLPTLSYQVEDRGDGPSVEWNAEPVPITAVEYMDREREDARKEREEKTETGACKEWLLETLKLEGGRMPSREIENAAKQAGFSRKVLNNAKERIGAKSGRSGFGKDSACFWEIPSNVDQQGGES